MFELWGHQGGETAALQLIMYSRPNVSQLPYTLPVPFHSHQEFSKVWKTEHVVALVSSSALHILCRLTLLLLHGGEILKGEGAHRRPPEGVGLHDGLQPRPAGWNKARRTSISQQGYWHRKKVLWVCQWPPKGHLDNCEFFQQAFLCRCWLLQ